MSSKPRSDRRRTTTLAAGAAGLLILVGVGWQQGWLRATPEPVVPRAPELLDPVVRQLIERQLRAVAERPRDPTLHGRLGMVYEANSLWTEARESYARALALEPGSRPWRYRHAVASQQAGDYEGAFGAYRELAEAEPSFAPVQQRLGLALLESGDLPGALEAFESVRASLPRSPAGYTGCGTVLRLQGQLDRAAERLESALALDPGNRAAHYQLGLTYRGLGRTEEARRHLESGLSAEVEYLRDEHSDEIGGYAVGLPATVERAERLRRTGDFDRARELLESALASHPDNLTLLNNLATTCLSLGDPGRARTLLERALEVGGDKAETLLNLAGWALATDRPVDSLGYAERALRLNPRLAPLHGVRAQALVKLRRYPEATRSMESALRLEVRDPALYLGLGVLYEVASRWRDALDLYERALTQWPDLPPALAGRCLAALELGDRETAAAALASLRVASPDDPRIGELSARLEGES